ncbi:hypothetical protein ACIPRI_02285 [Variovorax sp. LARHSF232]
MNQAPEESRQKKRESAWSGRFFAAPCEKQSATKKPGARNLGPVIDFTPLCQGVLQLEIV